MTHTDTRISLRRTASVVAAGVGLLAALAAFAYNPEQDRVNNAPVPTHWQNNTVQWNLNPTAGSNVSTAGGPSVQQTLTNAFNTWQKAQLTLNGQPTTVDHLTVTLGQVSGSLPKAPTVDCLNVVGFADPAKSDFPTGTIAFTSITTTTPPPNPPIPFDCNPPSPLAGQNCNLDSCLTDADIEFNPSQMFSTASSPPANAFSIQGIATHEIGHLLGLDHSGLANAVMYPFGDTGQTVQTVLSIDDAAGIAFLYPASNFASLTGIVSGTVTLGGSGAFAAHVVVVDASSGDVVSDTLTSTDGTYQLQGLLPGTYNLLVLPLAGVYDVTNFSGWSCGYAGDPATCTDIPTNPTNYTGRFH